MRLNLYMKQDRQSYLRQFLVFPSLHIRLSFSFSNLFYEKAVPTRDVINPVSLPSV